MSAAGTRSPSSLEWAIAGSTLSGEIESGDTCVVGTWPDRALVAVVDGLGHGREAAVAARCAATVLAERDDPSVIGLMRRCHAAMAATRGAAMSLAILNRADDAMIWLGVGNVEAVLVRADLESTPQRETILLPACFVRHELP